MKFKEYEMPDGRKAVFEYDHNGVGKITLECMDELMSMIADRPQGEWIFDPEILCSDIGVYSAGYRCSVCGKDYFKVDRMNYCPNCGARMKGADDE